MDIKYLFKTGDLLSTADLNGAIDILINQQNCIASSLGGPWFILGGLDVTVVGNQLAITDGYFYAQDQGCIVEVNGGTYNSPVYIYYKINNRQYPDPQQGPSSGLGAKHYAVQGILTSDLSIPRLYNYLYRPFVTLGSNGTVKIAAQTSIQTPLPTVPDHIRCGLTVRSAGGVIEVEKGQGYYRSQVVYVNQPSIFSLDAANPYINLNMSGLYQSPVSADLNIAYVTGTAVWCNLNRNVSLTRQHALLTQNAANQSLLINLSANANQTYLSSLGVYIDYLTSNSTSDTNNTLYNAVFSNGKVYSGGTPVAPGSINYSSGNIIYLNKYPLALTIPYTNSSNNILTGTTNQPIMATAVPCAEYDGNLVFIHGAAPNQAYTITDYSNSAYSLTSIGAVDTSQTTDSNGMAQVSLTPRNNNPIKITVGSSGLRVPRNNSNINPTPSIRQQITITAGAMWSGLSVGGKGSAYVYLIKGVQIVSWLYATGNSNTLYGNFRIPIYVAPGTYYIAISANTDSSINLTAGASAQIASGGDWSFIAGNISWTPVVATPTSQATTSSVTITTVSPFRYIQPNIVSTNPPNCTVSSANQTNSSGYSGVINLNLQGGTGTFPVVDLQATNYTLYNDTNLASWIRDEIDVPMAFTNLEVSLDAMISGQGSLLVYISSNGGQTWEQLDMISTTLLNPASGLSRYLYGAALTSSVTIVDSNNNSTTIPRTRLKLRIDFKNTDNKTYFQRIAINTNPGPLSQKVVK